MKKIVLPILCSAMMGWIANADVTVLSDGMDYVDDAAANAVWTDVGGDFNVETTATFGPSPLSSASQTPASGSFLSLNNRIAYRDLSQTITNDWSLSVKMLHNNYGRGNCVFLLDASGTQGYGIIWNSANVNQQDGNGYVQIRKFNNSSYSDFGSFGAGSSITATETSLQGVTGYAVTNAPDNNQDNASYDTSSWADFSTLELNWDASTGTLTLYQNGTLMHTVVDTDYSSFGRVYLRGNGAGYFDDVEVTADIPEPPAPGVVLADDMEYADDTAANAEWTAVGDSIGVSTTATFGPAPLSSASQTPASGTFLNLNNRVAYRDLSQTVTTNWSLSVKMLHNNYQRGNAVFMLDPTGTQGYGLFWSSARVDQFDGNGFVRIHKFNNSGYSNYGSFGAGTDLTGSEGSLHAAMGYAVTNAPDTNQDNASYDTSSWADFSTLRLEWDAATGTLTLYQNGTLMHTVVDTDYSSFGRVYLRGNGAGYFDDVEVTADVPINPASEILSIEPEEGSSYFKITAEVFYEPGWYSPVSTADLVGGSWTNIAHTSHPTNALLFTNLLYATFVESNNYSYVHEFYVQSDDAMRFIGLTDNQ